jgi:hypothetical protein
MDFSGLGYMNASCESEYSQTRAQDPGCNKDSNETNFDTDRRTRSGGLCGDIPDPDQTRQERTAHQLFRAIVLLGQVLRQRSGLMRTQGLQGHRQVG